MELDRAAIAKLTQDRSMYLITWDTEHYHVAKPRTGCLCGRALVIDWRTRTIWPQQARGLKLCPKCWAAFLASRPKAGISTATTTQLALKENE